MVTMTPNRACSVEGCDAPHHANNFCLRHYQRDRDRHRHRTDQRLTNRARGRALTVLAHNHPEEFERLVALQYAMVVDEAARVAEHTGDRLTKLLPGPRAGHESPADRIPGPKIECPQCKTYHDAGHRCPTCSVLSRDDIPRAGFGATR